MRKKIRYLKKNVNTKRVNHVNYIHVLLVMIVVDSGISFCLAIIYYSSIQMHEIWRKKKGINIM